MGTRKIWSNDILKKVIAKTPIIGRCILFVYRAKTALGYFKRPISYLLKWLFNSKETTNFTCDLEESNKCYLASLIADIVDIDFAEVMEYINEIEEDQELRQHIATATGKNDLAFIADKEVRYGKRIGWYALTRALKPKTVIETGVDKGLGSCVLTAALKKNSAEGHQGRYYGTDLNPKAGYLLSDDYANYGCILYGDSIELLNKFEGSIDLFINDSDHSAEYEAEEYKAIAHKLSEHAFILGDNSHSTDKLFKFSLETNRHFVFFQERPLDHWYPGGGIGISFKR